MISHPYRIILSLFLLANILFANTTNKNITLQLSWFDQFQFAGYYIAKEKGFYKEEGLDVTIKPFEFGLDIPKDVDEGKYDFAVGRETLILEKTNNKNIVALYALFQTSPLVLLSTKESGIAKITDFNDKKIMTTIDDASEVSIKAMITSQKLEIKNLNFIKHSHNIDDLINKKTDVISAYLSKSPYSLQKRNIPYNVFAPKDYGFDMYSDLLYTSEAKIINNPEEVIKFKKASLKGWEYAYANIEEAVDLILQKYNPQNLIKEELIFEANELKKLSYYNTDTLGEIDLAKLQRIYDLYNVMGLVNNQIDIDQFIYQINNTSLILTKEEKNYLNNKKELSVCVQPSWLPYEGIQNGQFIGISAEYLEIISDTLNLPLKIITAQTNQEMIGKLKHGQCDIKPIATKGTGKLPYKATSSNIEDYIALVTKSEQPFISDLNSYIDKKFVILKNRTRFEKQIKKLFPKIDLIRVDTLDEAFQLVLDGKAFGLFGKTKSMAYHIYQYYPSKLKIINEFEKVSTGIGVINSDPILYSIIEKALLAIDEKEKIKIRNNWDITTIEIQPDYTLFWYLLMVLFLVLVAFAYRQYLLKKSNDKLEEEKTRFEIQKNFLDTLVQTLPIPLFSKDKDGKYLMVNRKFSEFIGYSQEEIIGKSVFEVSSQEYADIYHEHDLKVLNLEENPQIYESKVKNKNTHEVYDVIFYKSAFFDKNNNVNGLIGTVIDLTPQKKLERERLEQEHLLQEQSKLASMGEMIGNISHQWRQPLSIISSGSTGMLMQKEFGKLSDEQFTETCNMINENAQYLSKTIDDFRNFIKNERLFVKFNLTKTMKSFLNLVNPSFKNDHIQIISDLDDSIEINGYPNELIQCFMNIFNNAKDAFHDSPDHDKYFFIETLKEDNRITIKFKDNAGGIPKEVLSRIFEPYFTTKHQSQGTGLGLSMTYTLITNGMKGSIIAKNVNFNYNENFYDGAEFIISLPLS